MRLKLQTMQVVKHDFNRMGLVEPMRWQHQVTTMMAEATPILTDDAPEKLPAAHLPFPLRKHSPRIPDPHVCCGCQSLRPVAALVAQQSTNVSKTAVFRLQ